MAPSLRHVFNDVLTAADFIKEWCAENDLSVSPQSSAIEDYCRSMAEQARSDYKEARARLEESQETCNAEALGMDTNSDEFKYARRLYNNRRSAHSAKVYDEVYRITLSSSLKCYDQANSSAQSDGPSLPGILTSTCSLMDKFANSNTNSNCMEYNDLLAKLKEQGLQLNKFKENLDATRDLHNLLVNIVQAARRNEQGDTSPPCDQLPSEAQQTAAIAQRYCNICLYLIDESAQSTVVTLSDGAKRDIYSYNLRGMN